MQRKRCCVSIYFAGARGATPYPARREAESLSLPMRAVNSSRGAFFASSRSAMPRPPRGRTGRRSVTRWALHARGEASLERDWTSDGIAKRCGAGGDRGDRDRGRIHILAPPTPPGMRVRTGRFEKLRLAPCFLGEDAGVGLHRCPDQAWLHLTPSEPLRECGHLMPFPTHRLHKNHSFSFGPSLICTS